MMTIDSIVQMIYVSLNIFHFFTHNYMLYKYVVQIHSKI